MRKLLPFLIPTLLVLTLFFLFRFLLHNTNIAVLFPQGLVAERERSLIILAMSLLLGLALPVAAAAFFIAWKYRADHTNSTYKPDWTGNRLLKSSWWVILSIYVIIFFGIVWKAAHELDPYKPIVSSVAPMTIQVVALQWKWLFIYPKENIATVNLVEFPVDTPVTFLLTADAPMNSFWIPNLSGQIYAMSSMQTQLHVLSHKTGDFPGKASEISGTGYAGMQFTAKVSTQKDYAAWIKQIKKSAKPLDLTTYNSILAKPSLDNPVTYYFPVDSNLYSTIIMKYMIPTQEPGKYEIIHLKH